MGKKMCPKIFVRFTDVFVTICDDCFQDSSSQKIPILRNFAFYVNIGRGIVVYTLTFSPLVTHPGILISTYCISVIGKEMPSQIRMLCPFLFWQPYFLHLLLNFRIFLLSELYKKGWFSNPTCKAQYKK